MIKTKKQMFIVISVFSLVMLLGMVTYAFFNYTRTGSTNTIRVGRISFSTRQTKTINLTNAFPISSSEIDNDTDNVDELTITIKGDTDYVDGVEYLITVTDANPYTNAGKQVPISTDITINGLGEPDDDYFATRNSKNATIYKRLSGDVITSNQMLLVGYIKPNTTSGTIEGIDGSITIKAYFDKDRIAISDTYDRTQSDEMGTLRDWVDGRTVLTTSEWNDLQAHEISFKVKIEANEGIWVNEPIYNTLRSEAVMDNIQSVNVSSNNGIDFSKNSGDTNGDNIIDNGQGLYIRIETIDDAYPVVYYRGNVDNNVYFAGKCWQMVRTTDTGGVKMIYNGENTGTEDAPACEPATGADRQITLNIDGVDTNTFAFSGEDLNNSLAYQSYTYNIPVYISENDIFEIGSKFGNDVIWDGENYTLTDISDIVNETHHYTCGTAGTITCRDVKFYILGTYTCFILEGGKTIEDALVDSLANGTVESTSKAMVEDWYENEIKNIDDAKKIEDTIYCNDRTIFATGMTPNSATQNEAILYTGYNRNSLMRVSYPSTKCLRVVDSYTQYSTKGNGLLDYPVGLITVDEAVMAGGSFSKTANHDFYLYTGVMYWTMSPLYYNHSAVMTMVYNDGRINGASPGFTQYLGLRPVISLKPNSSIASGEGTPTNPYIMK